LCRICFIGINTESLLGQDHSIDPEDFNEGRGAYSFKGVKLPSGKKNIGSVFYEKTADFCVYGDIFRF